MPLAVPTFTGGTPIPDPLTPGNILLPWSSLKVAEFARPVRIIIDVLTASFTFGPLKAGAPSYGADGQNAIDPHPCFSGHRSGYTLEGPFLQYTIARGSMLRLGERQPVFRGMFDKEQKNACDFFFDLQCKRPLYFPYPGSVSVIGQYPGSWQFQTFILEDSEDTERPSPIESEVPLTMNLAAGPVEPALGTTRTWLAIPPGAHSYTYRDQHSSNDPTLPLPIIVPLLNASGKTDTGPAGPLLETVSLSDPYTLASGFYTRWGLGNAIGLTVNGAGLRGQGQLTWHISLV